MSSKNVKLSEIINKWVQKCKLTGNNTKIPSKNVKLSGIIEWVQNL